MHSSAKKNAALFFETYGKEFSSGQVVEIGSQDVNGSLRELCPTQMQYVGLDFAAASGVDIVLKDPYQFPLADNSAEIVVSTSCFEHSQLFWLLFLEALRILKPNGLLYINAPSNGAFHRYPVDCWRFYPDSGGALVEWARRNGYSTRLLESFVSGQDDAVWNDFVAVFLKDEKYLSNFPGRILPRHPSYRNGLLDGETEFRNFQAMTEDYELARSGWGRKKLGSGSWPKSG